MSGEYRPRIVIEVTPEQFERVRSKIPWGIRRQLFSCLLDSLLDAFDKAGGSTEIIAAVMSRAFGPEDFLLKRKHSDDYQRDPRAL